MALLGLPGIAFAAPARSDRSSLLIIQRVAADALATLVPTGDPLMLEDRLFDYAPISQRGSQTSGPAVRGNRGDGIQNAHQMLRSSMR
jgi:uncharacterized protein (DUF1501 family)